MIHEGRIPRFRLVCFDVDGTLVDNVEYSWQVFHDHFDTDPSRRASARERFLAGSLSYAGWAEHDVGMWVEKNARRPDFFEAMSGLSLMTGARETVAALRNAGLKTAVISGSLDIVLEKVFPDFRLLFDDIRLNRLVFAPDGRVRGVTATRYDMAGKAEALREIAARDGVDVAACVFVGDHHNDVEIAKIAGLSIAFDAKDDSLRAVADVAIDEKDLRLILPHIL